MIDNWWYIGGLHTVACHSSPPDSFRAFEQLYVYEVWTLLLAVLNEEKV